MAQYKHLFYDNEGTRQKIVVDSAIRDKEGHVIDTYYAPLEELSAHKAAKTNPHAVTKVQVGLDKVDNTADIDKPISTATQTALNTKASNEDLLSAVTNLDTQISNVDTKVDDEITRAKAEEAKKAELPPECPAWLNPTGETPYPWLMASLDAESAGLGPDADGNLKVNVGAYNFNYKQYYQWKKSLPFGATQTKAGLMSAADKTKLDGLQAAEYSVDKEIVSGDTHYKLTKNGTAVTGAETIVVPAGVDISGKQNLLVGDNKHGIEGQPFNIPYYFHTTPAADKVTVWADTVKFDNNPEAEGHYQSFSLDVTAATQQNAGLMSKADKIKLDTLHDAEYAIVKEELQSGDTEYKLIKDGTTQAGATIVVSKATVLKSSEIKVCTQAGVPLAELEVGDKYIDLEWDTNPVTHSYISLKGIGAIYTAGDGIEINGTEISTKNRTAEVISGPNGMAYIFNEPDGGGAKFVNNKTDVVSFVGVNDGEGGPVAQIYADILVDKKWQGAKLDVTNTGMYYTVGNKSFAERAVLGNELATKKEIHDYTVTKSELTDKTEYKLTKDDIATGETIVVPKLDGNGVLQADLKPNITLGGITPADTFLAGTYIEDVLRKLLILPTYTVSYDANGGSGSMASTTVVKGGEHTLPVNGFTAPTGKVFDCWEVKGTRKAVNDKIIINGDTVIKALWKDSTITIYTQKLNPDQVPPTSLDGWEANETTINNFVNNGFFKDYNMDGHHAAIAYPSDLADLVYISDNGYPGVNQLEFFTKIIVGSYKVYYLTDSSGNQTTFGFYINH